MSVVANPWALKVKADECVVVHKWRQHLHLRCEYGG